MHIRHVLQHMQPISKQYCAVLWSQFLSMFCAWAGVHVFHVADRRLQHLFALLRSPESGCLYGDPGLHVVDGECWILVYPCA